MVMPLMAVLQTDGTRQLCQLSGFTQGADLKDFVGYTLTGATKEPLQPSFGCRSNRH